MSILTIFAVKPIENFVSSLHERALQIVYGDYKSSFEELLERDSSMSIHQQNIHRLIIEIFKSLSKVAPENFFDEQFKLKYRQISEGKDLFVPSVKTVSKGKCSARYFGTLMWNTIQKHPTEQLLERAVLISSQQIIFAKGQYNNLYPRTDVIL